MHGEAPDGGDRNGGFSGSFWGEPVTAGRHRHRWLHRVLKIEDNPRASASVGAPCIWLRAPAATVEKSAEVSRAEASPEPRPATKGCAICLCLRLRPQDKRFVDLAIKTQDASILAKLDACFGQRIHQANAVVARFPHRPYRQLQRRLLRPFS